jgi:hypothetical protein
MVACSSPTGPASQQSILAHRARWNAQNLTSYSYTYQFSAFIATANQPLRVEVRQDTVRSVVVVASGDTLSPVGFPTIDALFDRALHAAENGSLTRIAFDPRRGFPTLLGYDAIPDVLSSEQASAVEPLLDPSTIAASPAW